MRLRLIAIGVEAMLCLASAAQRTPAFPGAEGFGMFTTGGRGGEVYKVTKLADDGSEGTFRWACGQKGPRTVVFDVSGTIFLTSRLDVTEGNLTIAGQTAPGQGVCIADFPFTISADNVIVRFMRFRLGDRQVSRHEGDGLGGSDNENIIIDHCSVSWSIDECLSVYGNRLSTVQWCIVSQSLKNSGHRKGSHGYGGNWGGDGASYHHNLMAHHESRVPRLGPRPGTQANERMDLRNNVFYNWGGNGCYGGEAMTVNIVNNYYKPGPATLLRDKDIQRRIASPGIRTSAYTHHGTPHPNVWDKMWHVWGRFFVKGNVNSRHPEVKRDNWKYGVYNQISNSSVDGTYTRKTRKSIRLESPMPFAEVTTHTAEEAYERVLSYAGASLHRDWVDSLAVNDTRSGSATCTGRGNENAPGMINTQNDNRPATASEGWSAWPELRSLPAKADTDGDGMPDDWETAAGLNADDPSDSKALCADGYTNLEHYLNGIVAEIMDSGNKGGVKEGVQK